MARTAAFSRIPGIAISAANHSRRCVGRFATDPTLLDEEVRDHGAGRGWAVAVALPRGLGRHGVLGDDQAGAHAAARSAHLLVVATKGSAVGPTFLSAVRDAPYVTVATLESGHTVYVDRPVETGALVQEFLAQRIIRTDDHGACVAHIAYALHVRDSRAQDWEWHE